MDMLSSKLLLISIMALPFLLAVTLHEAGHAYAAHLLGDESQRTSGRLSLNPIVHLDPFGTVFMPLLAVLSGFPFLMGYAKPVMIQPRYFKKLRRDQIIVSVAGPFGNLVVAIFCAYVLRFALEFGLNEKNWVVMAAYYGIFMNCLFMVFNLLPIPPLDGGHVVAQFLPYNVAQSYNRIAPYGFFILIGIIIFAQDIILVPTMFMASLVTSMVGVPL